MSHTKAVPLFQIPSIALVMLSMSIGWGIRGNFGHEFGAMIAGTLASIAIALCSGREDWQRRVLFFGLFGGIGWGFGASMSYMQIVSYSQSWHAPSQLYGFFGVFVLGLLWSSLGGLGLAFAASETRERLTALFKPMLVVFFLWGILYFVEDPMDEWYKKLISGGDTGDLTWFRQKSPFYWLDADWMQALLALIGVCMFDLYDRWTGKRESLTGGSRELTSFIAFPVIGMTIGAGIQWLLGKVGILTPFVNFIVQPQGDPNAPIVDNGGNLLEFDPPLIDADFVTNWPQFFSDLGPQVGWMLGLLAGFAVFFTIYGKWRSSSSLILYMALGWYIVFLALPVGLSPFFGDVGGFRMTPPRSDNWAGVLGVWLGAMLWMHRNGLTKVNYVSGITAVLGGLGFMTIQFTKVMLMSFGNRGATDDVTVQESWKHWQSANWHSLVMEQGAGLLFGLALVISMGLLSTRSNRVEDDPPVRAWTEGFCAFFILNILLYVNLVKIVRDFTAERAAGFRSVPMKMKMPLIESVELSAWAWFSLMFLFISICSATLLAIHYRRRLLIVPTTWPGKGMMIYLLFLWAMVIGNFMKAVVAFHEQRLGTEGLIFVNAIIATFLILAHVHGPKPIQEPDESRWQPLWKKIVTAGIVVLIISAFGYTGITRHVYHGQAVGGNSPMNNMRFGESADWYIKPIIKTKKHR